MQRTYKMLSSIPCTSNNGRSVQVLNVKIITVPELTRSASSLTSVGADVHEQIAAPGLLTERVCSSQGTTKAVPAQSSSALLVGERRAVCEQQLVCSISSWMWIQEPASISFSRNFYCSLTFMEATISKIACALKNNRNDSILKGEQSTNKTRHTGAVFQ